MTLRSAFTKWAARSAAKRRVANAANTLCNEILMKRQLTMWRDKLSQIRLQERKAQVARTFFLGRRFWVSWVTQSIENRGRRLQTKQNRTLAKDAFAGEAFISRTNCPKCPPVWLDRTRNARSNHALVESFQDAVDAVRFVWVPLPEVQS